MKTESDLPAVHLDWPHAPAHRLGERGAYMVTAGTFEKLHYLNTLRAIGRVRLRAIGRYSSFST